MSIFQRDTQPVIGSYEFSWTSHGNVQVTDRSGKRKTYSEEALTRLSNSQGIKQADRDMATAALQWMQEHPFERIANEHKTTPYL